MIVEIKTTIDTFVSVELELQNKVLLDRFCKKINKTFDSPTKKDGMSVYLLAVLSEKPIKCDEV